MMIRSLRSSALCLLAAFAAPAQTLQLADGKVLLAKVEQATGEGLRVKRLDNGGVLDLRWEHLAPAAALAVKKSWNLAGETQDELLERAEEVEFLVGGNRRTEIGKIVERGSEIVLQRKGVQFRIPATEVRKVVQVDVPATQIYTKDEFYMAKRAQFAPGDQADEHLQLADELLRFRDYDRALEHLLKARELGNSLDPARLEREIARAQLNKENERESEQIALIQAARSRATLEDFEKGLKAIAQYQKDFPQGKLKQEFEAETKRFDAARTRFLWGQVADQFRRTVQTVAEKKVAEEGCTLQQARDYAENKMSDDLFARVGQQLRLDVAEVKRLWADRGKNPVVGKRTELFSYGLGTWVLGEQAILKGTEVGKQKDARQQKEETDDREVQRVANALKKALERRQKAMQGQGGEQQREQTDEDWWNDADRRDRRNWLCAYYAEFGGQLVVASATLEPCVSCWGEGSIPEMGGDGRMVRRKCFLCHGTKWLRRVKAY